MKKDIPTLALEMVKKYLDGYKIECIGATIFQFKKGESDSGNALMSNTQGRMCRDWLGENGVAMRRVDAGGSPEWEFFVNE